MAAPAPRSHRSSSARLRQRSGRSARGGALGRGWGAAARPPHPKEPPVTPPPPLPAGSRHKKGSVIHPRTQKDATPSLHPPPRVPRTLHGDGRVALLGVLGALHLQLLGRESPISTARGGWGGGKVVAQGHGVPPTLPAPPGPSLAVLEATHGCWVKECGLLAGWEQLWLCPAAGTWC